MSSLLTPLGGGITSPQLGSAGMNSSDSSGFDWNSEENTIKWKGNFVGPLQKILNQVRTVERKTVLGCP